MSRIDSHAIDLFRTLAPYLIAACVVLLVAICCPVREDE